MDLYRRTDHHLEAAFKKAADGGGVASEKGATSFVYDGANRVQVGGVLTWA